MDKFKEEDVCLICGIKHSEDPRKWINGKCPKCYYREYDRIKKEKAAKKKTQGSPDQNKPNADQQPSNPKPQQTQSDKHDVTDYDLFNSLLTVTEGLSKSIVMLKDKVDKNKATETKERVKLYNRIKAMESFVETKLF